MTPAAVLQEVAIHGLTADSRQVGDGYLFAAIPGSRADGRAFMADAVARGAVAVLAPTGTRFEDCGLPATPHTARGSEVQLVMDANPRRRLALMAARFYASQPATIAAVTGTNGKTSVAEFTRQIWALLKHSASSLGTLGLTPHRPGAPKALTTPDPVELHRCLSELTDEGVSHLAMEASSHGLDQFRLDGVRVTAAAFTNVSRDHLDYHGDMSSYISAKQRLFSDILLAGGTAVLNADSDAYERLAACCAERGLRVLSYGRSAQDLRLLDQQLLPGGQCLSLSIQGEEHKVEVPLVGAFQGMNLLAAVGLAIACGDPIAAVVGCLPYLTGVRGRVEFAAQRAHGGIAYVDYAHTPDALEMILTSLRPHTAGRLLVVFGCGGDRDRGKRPMMGSVALAHADHVIVTDDNPRSEDPAAIRAEILAAAPGAEEIGDRAAAIRRGVELLAPDDVLVVAGKGHESGQFVGVQILPFDDCAAVRAAVAAVDGERKDSA